MNTKRLLLVLIAGAVLTSVWWISIRPGPGSVQPADSSAAPVNARFVPQRVLPSRHLPGWSVDDASLPLTALFGPASAYPEPARFVLEQAVRCAQLIEARILRFPEGGSRRTAFRGLQEILLMDDYTVAMDLAGFDCREAESAAARVQTFLRTGQVPPAVPPAPAAGRGGRSVPPLEQRLSRLYALWFQTNPEYGPVLNELRLLTPDDPLASDLFKDAVLYTAQCTFFNDSKRDTLEWFQHHTPDATVDPAIPALWDEILEAYREIYSFRFRERHGLDGEAVVEALATLTLNNVGPDVRVPCP